MGGLTDWTNRTLCVWVLLLSLLFIQVQAQACGVNDTVAQCSVVNGTGLQFCLRNSSSTTNSSGVWSSCNATSCNVGYTLEQVPSSTLYQCTEVPVPVNKQLVWIAVLFGLFLIAASLVCALVIFLGIKGYKQRAFLRRQVNNENFADDLY